MIGVHIKQCLVDASSSSFLQKLISSSPVSCAEVWLSRSFPPSSIYISQQVCMLWPWQIMLSVSTGPWQWFLLFLKS